MFAFEETRRTEKEMNGYDYVRALLYAYPKMEMLAEAVRTGARVRAGLSFRAPRDTLSVMESIAADMQYADRLLVWKEQLERVLRLLGEEELFLLEYKYFRRRRKLIVMEEAAFPLSERSYFRRQRELLEKLSVELNKRGYGREEFFCDFEGFSPLMRICSALGQGLERRLVERRNGGRMRFKDDQNSSASGGEGERFPRRMKNAMAATAAMPTESAAICQPEGLSDSAGSGVGVSSAGPEVSVR